MPPSKPDDQAEPQVKPHNSEGNLVIRSYGSHKRLFPEGDTIEVEYIFGETVRGLLSRLRVPEEEVWLVTVNENLVKDDYLLSPGDRVSIMSPVLGG